MKTRHQLDVELANGALRVWVAVNAVMLALTAIEMTIGSSLLVPIVIDCVCAVLLFTSFVVKVITDLDE